MLKTERRLSAPILLREKRFARTPLPWESNYFNPAVHKWSKSKKASGSDTKKIELNQIINEY